MTDINVNGVRFVTSDLLSISRLQKLDLDTLISNISYMNLSTMRGLSREIDKQKELQKLAEKNEIKLDPNDINYLSSRFDVVESVADLGGNVFATTFFDRFTGKYIVGFAGTELGNSVTGGLLDLLSDAEIGLGITPTQYVLGARYISSLFERGIIPQNTTISAVGHSLGGGTAIYARLNLPEFVSEVTAISAPGIGGLGAEITSTIYGLIPSTQFSDGITIIRNSGLGITVTVHLIDRAAARS